MPSRPHVPLALLALLACSSDDPAPPPVDPVAPEEKPFEHTPGSWHPGEYAPTPRGPNARGFLDRKGLIHAHSVYSHDACDNDPKPGGSIDRACLDEFKQALCTTKLDFTFMTEHKESFADTEIRDALLAERFIERGGGPVAAWSDCDGRDPVMILAGGEFKGMMPVGLERHVGATAAERGAAYETRTPDAIAAVKDAGAVSLACHTEDWTADDLVSLPFDGFEMFNLHANALSGAAPLIGLLGRLDDEGVRLPHPNLVFVSVVSEDPRYLATWGSVLARGAKRVTTMGSDCHRNTFRYQLADGDRIDSYRRMMGWFSNHLLVRPDAGGAWDDLALKEALRSGRLYGVFEMLGIPVGFEFYSGTAEMGDEVPIGSTLHVTPPTLERLDPKVEPPVISARLLRAKEGGWDEVARSEAPIDFTADVAGAYRAEIRIKPRHLRPYLGDEEPVAESDLVWIYGNAIYVR